MDILPEDLKIEILSFFKYPDIPKIALLNKEYFNISNNDRLWNKLIESDFPFYPCDLPNARKSYQHWYQYFDKYALKVITKFITKRTKINDLQKVYEGIFASLVQDVMDNNTATEIEDKNEQIKYNHNFDMKICNRIFESLSVNIKLTSMNGVYPIYIYEHDSKDIKAAKKLLKIIYDMMMEYDDPK